MSGDTTNASHDYGDRAAMRCNLLPGVSMRAQRGFDVVYSYTPVLPGDFTVFLKPSASYDPEFWVTRELCGEESACVAQSLNDGTSGKLEQQTILGEANVTYYIIVDAASRSTNTARGAFTIVVR